MLALKHEPVDATRLIWGELIIDWPCTTDLYVATAFGVTITDTESEVLLSLIKGNYLKSFPVKTEQQVLLQCNVQTSTLL